MTLNQLKNTLINNQIWSNENELEILIKNEVIKNGIKIDLLMELKEKGFYPLENINIREIDEEKLINLVANDIKSIIKNEV